MAKFLVIAEKPSVAQSLAKNLSAYQRKDGYLEGNSCIVSWCLGHLAEYVPPEIYDEKYAKWQFEDLPIIPEVWKVQVSEDKKKQFDVICSLMNRADVAYLVNGCDAGREGELIFKRVYDLAGCQKPVKRLWISSMEDEAIQKGFQSLKAGKEYAGLCNAAVCRAQADWLIGMNATRAYTTRYFKRLVVGRVQTPTLAMLTERKEKIEHFKKEAYYKVSLSDGRLAVISENIQSETEAEELRKLIAGKTIKGMENFPTGEIQDIVFTTGTELEFWVKTPSEKETVQHLSISQRLKEQYWQRMRGNVRTAMEQAIEELDARGMHVEMGHKEVGGIKSKVDDGGHIFDVCEQLELDWLFSTNPLQAADNELTARIIIREVFRRNGLDVSFKAKPIIGVAGNGEHTHVGFAARLKNGKVLNLLAPEDLKKEYLSTIGYGFIMGVLNNYEATNPFISSTTDAFNRLKPGFEAPVCIVTSLGHKPEQPSRNRSILIGLIRDLGNPKATRFELRAPNPFTNTYLAVSCLYLTALDGVKYAVNCGKTPDELLKELSKTAGEDADYLQKEREYRCEKNVFEDYTQEERDAVFGKPPATVWENVKIMKENPDKVAVLTQGDGISDAIVDSFVAGIVYRWENELIDRLIPDTEAAVKRYKKLIHEDELDEERWDSISAKRIELIKDGRHKKCICTKLKEALKRKDYDMASNLQREMVRKTEALGEEYRTYALNIID